MEAVKTLGVDSKLLIAQIVNFLILLFLLRKFLYNPVIKMLDERKQKITEGLDAAEQSKNSLQDAGSKSSEIIEKAHLESKNIMVVSKKLADTEAKKIIEKADRQAEIILRNANEEATQNKQSALVEAKKEISEILSLSLDKVIGNDLAPSEKEKLTEKAIGKV